MHSILAGDIVSFNHEARGVLYLKVNEVSGRFLHGTVLNAETALKLRLPISEVEYVQPVWVSTDKLKQFARYEITYSDLAGGACLPFCISGTDKYIMSAEDVAALCRSCKSRSADTVRSQWLSAAQIFLETGILVFGMPRTEDSIVEGCRFLPTEQNLLADMYVELCNVLRKEENIRPAMEALIACADEVINMRSLPLSARGYSDKDKQRFISLLSEDDGLKNANDAEIELFASYVNELSTKDNVVALREKAYGCYGGNRAFETDWTASRDCLLRLMELDNNPATANSLGYIYYYGRTNGGEPQYDKAFYYFSIGAAGGVYESRYKLADMFANGFGVPKNEQIAADIIREMYDDTIGYIRDGIFCCKFADVALRMGRVLEKGIDCDDSASEAYYYYLQAEYAIRMRIAEGGEYGDSAVAHHINDAIDGVLPLSSYAQPQNTVRYRYISRLFNGVCNGGRRKKLKLTRLADGSITATLTAMKIEGETHAPKLFVTVPEAHFCGLVDKLSLNIIDSESIVIEGNAFTGETAEFEFDEVSFGGFSLCGKAVAQIKAIYELSMCMRRTRKYRFVSVVFDNRAMKYDYICDDKTVCVGNSVTVMARNEIKTGEVVAVFEKTATETALPITDYKRVLNKLS